MYNKANNDFSACEASIPQSAGLRITNQTLPTNVTSGEEINIQIAIECLKPFQESPTIEIQFRSGHTSHSYSLSLPVIMSSFFEPIASDKPTYMSRWKGLENEVQDIFSSSKTLNTDYLLYIRYV